MKFSQYLQNFWWKNNSKNFCLFDLFLPLLFLLQFLFIGVAKCRKFLLTKFFQKKLSIPLIVVGNLSVGGTGKTPLTLCLVQQLSQKGIKVGIISRGYGRKIDKNQSVLQVLPSSNPQQVGDEALLMSQRLQTIPIFVGNDRFLAAQELLKKFPQTQMIISDDGLQHYKIFRNAEIIVFDERGVGNGNCLPFGPLRENLQRLNDKNVAAIVLNKNIQNQSKNQNQNQNQNLNQNLNFFESIKLQFNNRLPIFEMNIFANNFYNLYLPNQIISATDLLRKNKNSQGKIFAIVGMGNPQKFFDTLSALNFDASQIKNFEKIIFKDHHNYELTDFDFLQKNDIVLMSEKDAVKCKFLQWNENQKPQNFWVLPISVAIPSSLTDIILEKINAN